jgi:Predicted NTPase (NACHT family)
VLKGIQEGVKGRDIEDDILMRQTVGKDIPDFELEFSNRIIADGAAFIYQNQEKEPMVQLIGMPKIGKTSLLRKIAVIAAQDLQANNTSPAPLLVNLGFLASFQISSKMELIESFFSQYEEFEAYLREKFLKGQILLLLDEMDKVPNIKGKIIEWVLALKTFVNFPLCVLASRYSGYIEIPKIPVFLMEIYPMKLQVSMAQSMLSDLQFDRFVEIVTNTNSHFSEFANTPYMLSLLIEMFR